MYILRLLSSPLDDKLGMGDENRIKHFNLQVVKNSGEAKREWVTVERITRMPSIGVAMAKQSFRSYCKWRH